MKQLKIKVITGFREDQYYTIDVEEAHKAYWLFTHPEERGVFKNGVALIGKNIQGIEPDYNATMGWNPTHELQNEDWADLRHKGIDRKLRDSLSHAREIALQVDSNPQLLNQNLSTLAIQEPTEYTDAVKSLSNILKV